MTNERLLADNKEHAFLIADRLTNYDYEYDIVRSKRAGYSIYFTTKQGATEYICDLGDRLEVNLENGKSINVWIKDIKAEARKELVELAKSFGYTAF